MYILVRKDLSINKRMTQCLHCMANFVILSNIKSVDDIIILEVDNHLELLYYNDLLVNKGENTHLYKDCDGKLTSIIIETSETSKKCLQRLSVLK
jgi:hypothetical protein